MSLIKFYLSRLEDDKKSFQYWSKLYELNKNNNSVFIPGKYNNITCRQWYLQAKMSRLGWIARSHALIRKELAQHPLM